MICGIEFVDWAVKLGKGVNGLSSGGPDTPQRNRNNIPDPQLNEDGKEIGEILCWGLSMKQMAWTGICREDRE